MNQSTTPTWDPTAEELEAILASMRPVIQRFADRDSRRMAELLNAA
jgi:hypothetical protein